MNGMEQSSNNTNNSIRLNMNKIISLLIVIVVMTACTCKMNKLEEALEKAKNNRSELLKVLDYYKNDSLKQKAAVFLIENMPDKIAYHYKYIDSIEALKKEWIVNGFVKAEDIEKMEREWLKPEIQKDIECITADFLISNIDDAFQAWHERPWGKYIPFDVFCEYILPYKANNEPLEKWRKVYKQRYSFLLDSVYTGTDVIEATKKVCEYLKMEDFHHTHIFNTTSAGPGFALNHRIGKCVDELDLTMYVMRALGIPVSIDHYPFSPESLNNHAWCVVQDSTQENASFYYSEYSPKRGIREGESRKMCKMFRRTYAKQADGSFQKDVSDEYFKDTLTMHISDAGTKSNLYLGVFNRDKFYPLAKSTIKGNNVSFGYVEANCIYIILSKEGKDFIPFTDPFIFDGKQLNYFSTDNAKKELSTIKIYRKYPFFDWNKERRYRIIDSKFEGSNTIDFKNPQMLYHICDTPQVCFNKIALPNKRKFRYIRYKVRENAFLELAELHFYQDNEELKPINIAACEPYYANDDEFKLANCFDYDPLTYFLSKEEGQELIFDFGSEVLINNILCIPRNDDNFIRPGDTYELFYWGEGKKWISLGKQKAVGICLQYANIPKNALLFLHDETRGREEEVFFLKNGKQYFVNSLPLDSINN